ncbi:MAG: hypothetical protein IJE83_03600 [Oscillospiraceae bacterium]|nr:hypothetical protein [Oscillospiraceae bacterium]MBQ2861856.1 hypothetical protein [Oscillospiraceae bacterium]MBQ2998497.1 hypothetical protein [Oscillospiraceae bacterium]MBQ6699600.1 hypothetical protein [Oscillospiraceae bacterium]
MSKKINRPLKDERDQEIQIKSESHALNFVIAATQILTIICLFKGNPAWKGSLALLFIGAAAELFYKHHKYEEKPYFYIGVIVGLIGIGLLIWFGFTG